MTSVVRVALGVQDLKEPVEDDLERFLLKFDLKVEENWMLCQ